MPVSKRGKGRGRGKGSTNPTKQLHAKKQTKKQVNYESFLR